MKIQVCNGKMCSERFSSYIKNRLEKDRDFFELKDLEVIDCPCTGNCKFGPSLIVDGDIQIKMDPVKASEIARGKKTPMNENELNQLKQKLGGNNY